MNKVRGYNILLMLENVVELSGKSNERNREKKRYPVLNPLVPDFTNFYNDATQLLVLFLLKENKFTDNKFVKDEAEKELRLNNVNKLEEELLRLQTILPENWREWSVDALISLVQQMTRQTTKRKKYTLMSKKSYVSGDDYLLDTLKFNIHPFKTYAVKVMGTCLIYNTIGQRTVYSTSEKMRSEDDFIIEATFKVMKAAELFNLDATFLSKHVFLTEIKPKNSVYEKIETIIPQKIKDYPKRMLFDTSYLTIKGKEEKLKEVIKTRSPVMYSYAEDMNPKYTNKIGLKGYFFDTPFSVFGTKEEFQVRVKTHNTEVIRGIFNLISNLLKKDVDIQTKRTKNDTNKLHHAYAIDARGLIFHIQLAPGEIKNIVLGVLYEEPMVDKNELDQDVDYYIDLIKGVITINSFRYRVKDFGYTLGNAIKTDEHLEQENENLQYVLRNNIHVFVNPECEIFTFTGYIDDRDKSLFWVSTRYNNSKALSIYPLEVVRFIRYIVDKICQPFIDKKKSIAEKKFLLDFRNDPFKLVRTLKLMFFNYKIFAFLKKDDTCSSKAKIIEWLIDNILSDNKMTEPALILKMKDINNVLKSYEQRAHFYRILTEYTSKSIVLKQDYIDIMYYVGRTPFKATTFLNEYKTTTETTL